MQPNLAAAFRRELAGIAANPVATHANVTALTGTKDGFCLRLGDWRALYRIDRQARTMFVEAVLLRRGAYG